MEVVVEIWGWNNNEGEGVGVFVNTLTFKSIDVEVGGKVREYVPCEVWRVDCIGVEEVVA